MKISNLCQTRLHLSLNSLKSNPTVPECITQTFSQILQSINEHSLNIQFLESQLISKVNSMEFNYGLAQKLSMVEFLQYFGKIQKIIQAIERNQKKEKQKIEGLTEEQNCKIGHMEQIMQAVNRDWDRKKKSQQLESQTLRSELKDIKKKLQKIKSQQQSPHSQFNTLKIADELKDLEQCCSDMKINIDQLVKDFKLSLQETKRSSLNQSHCGVNITQNKFVTFDQLREVLTQLQKSLTSSIGNYLSNINLGINAHDHANKSFGIENNAKSFSRKHYTQNSDSNDFSFHSISNSNITNMMPWTNTSHSEILLTPTFNPNHYMKQSVHQFANYSEPVYNSSDCISVEWKSKLIQEKNGRKLGYETKFMRNSSKNLLLGQKNARKSVNISSQFSKVSTKPQSLNSSINFRESRSSSIYEIGGQSIKLKQKGYYQLICGFLPSAPSQLMLLMNEQIIASHVFTEIPRKFICRAIMMYIKVDSNPSQVKIYCSPLEENERKLNEVTNYSGNIKSTNKKNNRLESQNFESRQLINIHEIKGFLCIKKLI